MIKITLKLVAVMLLFNGCIHPKLKFRKGRILDPTMDPAKTAGFHTSMRSEAIMWHENGSGEVGGAIGGSCPTCGG